jgi:hypothetical protein
MKPARKYIIITTAIILLIISAGFIVQLTLLPGLVQKEIIRALNKSGFSDAQVKVKSVTYWGADLENLNIGLEKKFQIKRIRVSYSLWSLIKGKVNAINLFGAQADLGVKNRVLDLGPLSSITGGGKSNETLTIPFANLFLKESSLLLNVDGQSIMVPLEAIFRATGNNTGVFELQARVKNAKIKTSAIVDLNKKSFKGAFAITALDLDVLKLIGAVYPSLKQISGTGLLNASGKVVVKDKKGSAECEFTGSGFEVHTRVRGYDLTFSPVSLTSKAAFVIERGNISMTDSLSLLKVSRIFNKSLGITAKNLIWSLPYDWKEKKVTQGSMTIEGVDLAGVSLAKINSSFQVDKNKLKMKVKSALGPWTTVNAFGDLYFDRQGLTGVINAKVPAFTTQNKKWLAGLIPPIKDDELSGTLSADARLKIEKGNILQQYTFDLKDVEWKKSGTDTAIQGVTGVLGLNSFVPLITDGEQRVTFKNAHTGAFKVEKGQTIFNFVKNDILYIKSLEMNWAGGRLSSKNIQLEFSKPHIAGDLNVDALNLQDILDFMDYQGVKGDGRIYGHVPITVDWGKHPRLSFGDGYLEAIPPTGGLQFSKTTAMQILGIEKDIDPKTKNDQEIVSLMMLRALQDMEYSQLKMVFKNDENNILKTRVQAKGYGPRSQNENRVPIGGLDITISNLDELLNRMVIPQLMGKK